MVSPVHVKYCHDLLLLLLFNAFVGALDDGVASILTLVVDDSSSSLLFVHFLPIAWTKLSPAPPPPTPPPSPRDWYRLCCSWIDDDGEFSGYICCCCCCCCALLPLSFSSSLLSVSHTIFLAFCAPGRRLLRREEEEAMITSR